MSGKALAIERLLFRLAILETSAYLHPHKFRVAPRQRGEV